MLDRCLPAPLASVVAVTPSPPGYKTPSLAPLTSPTPYHGHGSRSPVDGAHPSSSSLWPCDQRTGHWFSLRSRAPASSRLMLSSSAPESYRRCPCLASSHPRHRRARRRALGRESVRIRRCTPAPVPNPWKTTCDAPLWCSDGARGIALSRPWLGST